MRLRFFLAGLLLAFSTDRPAEAAGGDVPLGPPPNDTCVGVIPLVLGIPVEANVEAAANDYAISSPGSVCFPGIGNSANAAAGRDVVYSFTAPSAGTYSFRAQSLGVWGGIGDLVLYASPSCPGAPPAVSLPCNGTLAAANRKHEFFSMAEAEEVYCRSMAASETLYLFVDELAGGGGATVYEVEVTPCVPELEPNGTPATAGAFVNGIEGTISPAGDVDFFSLGAPAAGSRLFAVVDGVFARPATGDADFDLRVTTSTDTLEYDDDNNSVAIGALSPNVAGTPLTGAPSFLRVSCKGATTQAGPYRVFSIVQPPGSGLGGSSATPAADSYDQLSLANHAANYFFDGTSPPFHQIGFAANAGDLVQIGIDGDPLRDGTPENLGASLFCPTQGEPSTLYWTANDPCATSDPTPASGTLVATTPNSPAEAILWRAPASEAYVLSVGSSSGGDFLVSIGINGLRGDQLVADVGLTATGPAEVAAGSDISYTITLRNDGVNAASPITWVGSILPGTTSTGFTKPAGWWNAFETPDNLTFGCKGRGLGTGVERVFTMKLHVDCAHPSGPIENTFTVSSLTHDPNASNDRASVTTIITTPLHPPQPAPFDLFRTSVQAGEAGVAYVVPPVSGAAGYLWSYSGAGATIHGSGSAVTVDFSEGATSGELSVAATNGCSSGSARTISVVVLPALPGVVPGGGTAGTPLRLAGTSVTTDEFELTWGGSCGVARSDYGIYGGAVGRWYSHGSVVCSTGGALSYSGVPAPSGDAYYLVVPLAASEEGGYGKDSAGGQVPPGSPPCRTLSNPTECP
jgi:hypothetical protein